MNENRINRSNSIYLSPLHLLRRTAAAALQAAAVAIMAPLAAVPMAWHL